jgi:hypothetical protein
MGREWTAGKRDESERTPLQGGGSGGAGERRDRHVLLGVSHPTGDPARHRVFEIRAVRHADTGRWTARVGEQDRNEQLGQWEAGPEGRLDEKSFATPAECIGHAVATVVAAVDRDANAPP